MPIKDKSKYPKNWNQIRWDILQRAGNKCETCGVENYAIGYRDLEGKFYDMKTVMDELDNNGNDLFNNVLKHTVTKKWQAPKQPTKIVLTIAHINHDTSDNDYSNLIAECQYDHLKRDKQLHLENSRATRQVKSKQQQLF